MSLKGGLDAFIASAGLGPTWRFRLNYFNFQLTIALVAGFAGAVLTTPSARQAQLQWPAIHEGRIITRRRQIAATLQAALVLQWCAVLVPLAALWSAVIPGGIAEPWSVRISRTLCCEPWADSICTPSCVQAGAHCRVAVRRGGRGPASGLPPALASAPGRHPAGHPRDRRAARQDQPDRVQAQGAGERRAGGWALEGQH